MIIDQQRSDRLHTIVLGLPLTPEGRGETTLLYFVGEKGGREDREG